MSNIKDIKNEQLGMNYSTASNRLVKDLLFNFIVTTGCNECYRCGESMERFNFSIEHKTPWLHSDNPKDLFFDLSNISFSHLKCNVENARRKESSCGTTYRYNNGCRCFDCTKANTESRRKYYSPENRKVKYLKHGY